MDDYENECMWRDQADAPRRTKYYVFRDGLTGAETRVTAMRTYTRAIEDWFTYHAPTPEQSVTYEKLRNAAKDFAHLIDECVPDCADKDVALRKLREALMTANVGVACNGAK